MLVSKAIYASRPRSSRSGGARVETKAAVAGAAGAVTAAATTAGAAQQAEQDAALLRASNEYGTRLRDQLAQTDRLLRAERDRQTRPPHDELLPGSDDYALVTARLQERELRRLRRENIEKDVTIAGLNRALVDRQRECERLRGTVAELQQHVASGETPA